MATIQKGILAAACILAAAFSASAATVQKTYVATVTSSTPPEYALGDLFELGFGYDPALAPADGLLAIDPSMIAIAIGGVDPLFAVDTLTLDVVFAGGAVADFSLDFVSAIGAVEVNLITASIAGAAFGGETFVNGAFEFASASTGAFKEVGATPIPLPAGAPLLLSALLLIAAARRRG